jgi:GNAT superfamily N-acetyltransferase
MGSLLLKITIIPTIYEDMNTYAILNHVCVKPDVRRHHLGTKLLDATFRICAKCGVKTVELWSKNFREAAHALYKHYGFEVVDAKFFSKDI